jgi:hypothetical protein
MLSLIFEEVVERIVEWEKITVEDYIETVQPVSEFASYLQQL